MTRSESWGRAAASITGALVIVAITWLAGCGATTAAKPTATTPTPTPAQRDALSRADAIAGAVRHWARATTIAGAHAAAAQARALVTGPNVSAFPSTRSNVTVGLLPSDDGAPGLATPVATGCVVVSVLGGSWTQPRKRWSDLAERIKRWRPDHNTFPQLPSHAQRVVGWATLTLDTGALSEAIEYAGHATGHAGVVRDALRDPHARPCPG